MSVFFERVMSIMLRNILWYVTTKMGKYAVEKDFIALGYVSDKAQKICKKKLLKKPIAFLYVSDEYKNLKMYERTVKRNPYLLIFVPDQYLTQDMSNETVKKCP